MLAKDWAQLTVSLVAPFIAAGAALLVATLGRRDRVSIDVGWDYYNHEDVSLAIIHNRSAHAVAVTSVRYLEGVLWRTPQEGTALDYDDPTDLGFPYVIQPGALLKLRLDDHAAKKIAERAGIWQIRFARLMRRSRLLIECRTTAGTRYRTSGEPVLPWDEQLSWRRGQ